MDLPGDVFRVDMRIRDQIRTKSELVICCSSFNIRISIKSTTTSLHDRLSRVNEIFER